MQVAGEHRLDELIERYTADRHPELLTVPLVSPVIGHFAEVAGEEHPDRLAGATRTRVVVEEQVPLPRHEVGFLVQLAGRRGAGAARRRRRAARQAAPTRRHPRGGGTAGRAPRAPPRRARARRRHRCGRGGPGSPRRRRRGPRAHGAPATRARRGRAPRTAPAAGRYGPAADQAWASACSWWRGRSTSTRRAARCCSIAAPMSPAKSGCARVGRDLNSGCACVET